MSKILLIDGHSILSRAYFGVPLLSNKEGLHTNAIYGFINIMLANIEEEGADYIAVAFDVHEKTFRHELYPEYKQGRRPMDAELKEQVPVMQQVLRAMNIPVITLAGYEADDILGTLSKRCAGEGFDVSILSGDRDLFQLIDEKIIIRMPKTVGGKTVIKNYGLAELKEEYNVTPSEFIELKALMGDSGDNIKGIPKIGPKIGSSIISTYHSIENAYEHIDEIKPPVAQKNMRENRDVADLALKLVRIDTNAPVDFCTDNAKADNMFNQDVYEIFVKLELKKLLSKFKNCDTKAALSIPKFIVVDNPFDANMVENAESVGIALNITDGAITGLAVSCEKGNYYFEAGGFMTEDYLKDILNNILNGSKNISMFDKKKYLDYMDNAENVDDIMVMKYLLNPESGKYDEADMSDALQYAQFHAFESYNDYPVLLEKLKEQSMDGLYFEIEKPLIMVLKAMEKAGIRVDKEELSEYGSMLSEKIAELTKTIYEKCGEEFNINSPKKLGEILFEKLSLPSGKKTKTGYSTSSEVLEKLASQYPLVQDILDYRTYSKLKSTYADGLVEYIKDDGRIHGVFNQTITATGRLSSTEPNLQNIPIRTPLGRQIRKVFKPACGCIFLDADYSQIELRLLAHMSEDEGLISAYGEDEDIHKVTASKVFRTPLNEVTKEQRSKAKAVNFGIVYGISSFGLGRDLNISKKEASAYIEEYFRTYPKVKQYLDGLIDSAKKKGYSETLFKRKRPINELKSENFMQRSFGERIAMNSPIQGTAADIIKIAMINVYKRLKNEGLESRLILQIHDELLLEVKKEELPLVSNLLCEEMQNAADLRVKLEVAAETGEDWYEAK